MENETLNIVFKSYLSENPWIFLLLIWIIIWKGLALWQAVKHNQKIWFVALLVVNTLGLLEIIYLTYTYFKKRTTLQ